MTKLSSSPLPGDKMSVMAQYSSLASYPDMSSSGSTSSGSPNSGGYLPSSSPAYLSSSPETSHNIQVDTPDQFTTFHNLQTLVEVSTRVAEGSSQYRGPIQEQSWQHQLHQGGGGLRSVQEALNSQPSLTNVPIPSTTPLPNMVTLHSSNNSSSVISLPISEAMSHLQSTDLSLWHDNGQFKLEGLETLDLSVPVTKQDSSQILETGPRPTILPYRDVVLSHPHSHNHMTHHTDMSHHGDMTHHTNMTHHGDMTHHSQMSPHLSHMTFGDAGIHYVNLNGEPILPGDDPHHLAHHPGDDPHHLADLQENHPQTPLPNSPEPHRRSPSHQLDSKDGIRLCKVCGEKAGKHSYYGGQVCPSCRAFFRRSVQSGYNDSYFCVKDGSCEVSLKTRKNCQFCRYKLCVSAGMKTSWVLSDKERQKRFENGRGKRKSVASEGEQCSPLVDSSMGGMVSGVVPHITEQELATAQEYVRASGHWDPSKVGDMDHSLIREIIRMVAFRAKLSETGSIQLKELLIGRSKKFALTLPEMRALDPLDQTEILTNNVPILLKLKISTFFNESLTWTSQLASILGTTEVEKLSNKLQSLNVSGLEDLQLQFDQFFSSPYMRNEEAESDFSQLLIKIGSWPQDEIEYVLMSLILLFCPDQLILQQRSKVEATQLHFAIFLQRYIKSRYNPDEARSRFAGGMLLVSKCKEMEMICINNKINFEI